VVGCLIVTSVYTFVARSLVGQDAPNMSVADPESTSGIPFLKGQLPHSEFAYGEAFSDIILRS
jgi:hypothetical protein